VIYISIPDWTGKGSNVKATPLIKEQVIDIDGNYIGDSFPLDYKEEEAKMREKLAKDKSTGNIFYSNKEKEYNTGSYANYISSSTEGE